MRRKSDVENAASLLNGLMYHKIKGRDRPYRCLTPRNRMYNQKLNAVDLPVPSLS